MFSKKNYDIPKSNLQKISQIKDNNMDSSVTLAYRSIDMLMDLLENNLPNDLIVLKELITSVGIKLIKAQPEMAIIFNLVNNVFNAIESIKNPNEIDMVVKKTCKLYKDNLNQTNEKISKYTSKIIKNNYSILTHSFSKTVLISLINANQFGNKINVYVTESRPKNEGVVFAKELIKNNIETTLIVDAAAYEILQNIDIVLVGADKINTDSVINKIGTYALALSAKQKNKPCYVLCGSQKFLPSINKFKINKDQNPSEILKSKIKNIRIQNFYFDSTPINLFSNIITEKGKQTPSEINQQIKNISIHPKLIPYI